MTAEVKPVLSYFEQLCHLKEKGLQVYNDAEAIEILSTTNYYRLINAYSLGLYDKKAGDKERFLLGTSFTQIHELYQLDEVLRHILAELIEDFEIQFRTKVAYTIAINQGALGYLKEGTYENLNFFQDFLTVFEREKKNQIKSPIVKHHLNKYNGAMPIWAAVEILSFGTISKLYQNLKLEYRTEIAKELGIGTSYLPSWLYSFIEVRNICAHYGRLYNKRLIYPPKLYPDVKKAGINANYVFAVLYLLKRFIRNEYKWFSAVTRLEAALNLYHAADLKKVGFPDNWKTYLSI